jgi:hypothetical protein
MKTIKQTKCQKGLKKEKLPPITAKKNENGKFCLAKRS